MSQISQQRPLSARFVAALKSLMKKPCIAYDTGPEAGSFVDLHFGRRVPRTGPLEHPTVHPELRQHEGELSVFVSCAWRLESADEILCGCWDDKSPGGQMRAGLDRLVGQRVRRVLTHPPGWDLVVELDGGLLLRVFCDQTNDDEGADNWALFTPDRVFVVGTLSDLFEEPRQSETTD